MNLQSARRYEELLTGEVEASPYDYSMLFQGEGWLARRRSKRRFKLLQAIAPKLDRILRTGERVYWITTGTTVSLGEQFFVGWAAYYLNRRALVFTTERILLLEVDQRSRPRKLASQIPYTAIASVKATWTGICRIRLLNKKNYNFQSVPRADRKFLAQFLSDIVQGTNAPFQRIQGLEHLCPFCFTLVPGHPPACSSCGGGFKSPQRAGLLSMIFPGLGDWYLGHRGFAVMEMLGSGFLWLVLVIVPLLPSPSDDPEEFPPPDGAYWLTVAIILLVTHGIDAVMTRHFALKGHHPHGPAPAGAAVVSSPA